MNKKKTGKKKKNGITGEYMSLGMCLGVTFGIILDNLAIGISVGMLAGLAIDEYNLKKKNKESAKKNDEIR